MLPEKLSAGLTSLLEKEDRAAIVTEYVVEPDGGVTNAHCYAATVRNKAQLTYNGVGPWLDGASAAPPDVAASADLASAAEVTEHRRPAFARGSSSLRRTELRTH